MRPKEAMGAVAERHQSEAITLAFREQRQVQSRIDVAVEDVFTCAQPRRIENGIDLLRMFHLVLLDGGKTATRGGFPVNIFEAVARQVMTQIIEFPALADLAAEPQSG